MDKETIAAGLLHDIVEDTEVTKEELAIEFSEEIALLVDGVTKLTKLNLSQDKIELQAENLRKMFLAMALRRRERRWTFMRLSHTDSASARSR